MPNSNRSRIALTVQGQVQGVGFRPFVWRLAHAEALTGFVANTSAGVRMELQGPPDALERFARRLETELPPLAKIISLRKETLPVDNNCQSFEIRQSEGHSGQNVLVSPDVAICQDCLADIREPGNARFAYPFTNCTNCGPRFSITRSIPYDRPATTMACFELCQLCAQEYSNPANRRFHAQPIACPACGPKIWFTDKNNAESAQTASNSANSVNALEKAGQSILAGQILALRGLGGFQLVCDALNPAAVSLLRQRKNRPHKALAVMARNLPEAAQFCEIGEAQKALLTSPASPITLCRLIPGNLLPSAIAPDSLFLGLMLPYTPLHALLLDWMAEKTQKAPLLVMTSANPQGEPICLGNREAIARLGHLADAWLCHNRDILCRVDDSVVMADSSGPTFIRRARGYVPEPVSLARSGPAILGAGAELKAAFCLTRGANAFMGQHIGDLTSPANMEFYEQSLRHLQNLLETTPQAIVHDLHPDFLSTRFARDLAAKLGIPAIPLQHHAAHAMACLAENSLEQPALALCLDGSGLGPDKTIWGGELLYMDSRQAAWERPGSLDPFPLPGGDAAIREPWRIALALRWQSGLPPANPARAEAAIIQMLEKGLNCPATSSCGRLFDAVSSLLGLCGQTTYEGQAALRLEKAARQWLAGRQPWQTPYFEPIPIIQKQIALLDTRALFLLILELREQKMPVGAIAAVFHHALAQGLTRLASQIGAAKNIRHLALTGGVLQNGLMAALLRHYSREQGLTALMHRQVPPGDGGIALGQAAWGLRLAALGLLDI